MPGNPYHAAITLYDWATASTTNEAALRAEYTSAISAAFLTKGGSNNITSASKNGVSYSVLVGLTEQERINAIRIALAYVDAGTRPTTRAVSQF